MRHTVRRPPREVEQAAPRGRTPGRAAAGTGGSGVASGATPARCVLTTTRIPHKVPERTSDSGS
ncbi:hypothetical protein CP969_17645 [Streptomyces viridosporus T7A]|uniref:Uncharacterized protein n=1 Tax=Streptomyces viridosporus T7A TaxID=665577 RepID=A0ABX6AGG3_STRVD|nr:hypothetical protein CP969_17645 [Streptomyces viridosporus T7A]